VYLRIEATKVLSRSRGPYVGRQAAIMDVQGSIRSQRTVFVISAAQKKKKYQLLIQI
jgi:hypothetical protein